MQNDRQGRIQYDFRGEVDLIISYLLCVFGQTGQSKQCSPSSDAAKRGVWSGSTLFATHPAILHAQVVNGLVKKCKEKSPKFIFPHENELLSQGGGGGGLNWIPPPPLNPPLTTRVDVSLNKNSDSWKNDFRAWTHSRSGPSCSKHR